MATHRPWYGNLYGRMNLFYHLASQSPDKFSNPILTQLISFMYLQQNTMKSWEMLYFDYNYDLHMDNIIVYSEKWYYFLTLAIVMS